MISVLMPSDVHDQCSASYEAGNRGSHSVSHPSLVLLRETNHAIACLNRTELYPTLQDHSTVLSLEHRRKVLGMAKDVFFFDHAGSEVNGQGHEISHHNPYEVSDIPSPHERDALTSLRKCLQVEWCVTLVKHFLK
jgi:hypothetical protein